MKKLLKKCSSNLIVFAIFLGIGSIFIVKALVPGNSVDYSNSTSGMTATTVNDALDELYALNDQINAVEATIPNPVGKTTYASPQILYLDPTNLQKVCRETDTNIGENRTSSKPCIKWYIFAEDDRNTQDKSDDIYIAILDHNTTATVSNWSTALTQVNTDSSTWQTTLTTDSTKHARLITGQEVADIVGNTTWTSSGSGFFFEGSQLSGTGTSKYAWLFDYTDTCINYGCNVANSNNYGYRTSTSKSASNAWNVSYGGTFTTSSSGNYGVRPVIEINKSVLLNRG